MPKIPKKAQVAFNQFIFDTMMNKIREVELLEKRIKVAEQRHEITDRIARENWKRIGELESGANTTGHSLLKRVEKLEQQIEFCLKDLNGGMQPGDRKSLDSRVMELERNKADALTLSGKGGDGIRVNINKLATTIEALQKEIKDQREDYHAHIRQLVEENEAAHKKLQRERDAKGRSNK